VFFFLSGAEFEEFGLDPNTIQAFRFQFDEPVFAEPSDGVDLSKHAPE